MLELSHPAGEGAKLAYGGDVLNTAIYLARFGLHPHFVSALGTDPYSEGMIKEWERECVQTGHILRDADRLPGLYAIQTDHRGERSFYYWRDNSAARNFFNLDDVDQALTFMEQADWLYLSGITLSIYNDAERAKLCAIAKTAKDNGKQVVFDPNYRPRGGPTHPVAAQAMQDFAVHSTLILATIDDENLLYGQQPGSKHAARWLEMGVETVVLKCGPRGAIIYEPGQASQNVPVTICEQPVDTTGAGDSFNAAFIAAKCLGHSNLIAAQEGNRLASQVIRYPGAIMPAGAMPTFEPGT